MTLLQWDLPLDTIAARRSARAFQKAIQKAIGHNWLHRWGTLRRGAVLIVGSPDEIRIKIIGSRPLGGLVQFLGIDGKQFEKQITN